MKTKVRNYILICFILISISISSCYKEDRINPSPRSSTTTSPPIQNPTNNPTNNLPELAVTSLISSRTESIDSNINSYYSSLKFNLNFIFNSTGSVYISIYTNSNISNENYYHKIHDSKLIAIPSNLKLDYNIALFADSLLKAEETKTSLSFYLTLTNHNGVILQTTTSSYYNNYSKEIKQYPLGENYSAIQFEKSKSDSKMYLGSLSFEFNNTIDKNKNTFILSPESISLTMWYNFKTNKKFFAEIYYPSPLGNIVYAKTEVFEFESYYFSKSTNVSKTLQLVIVNPLDLNRNKSLNFKLKLYDASTNEVLRESDNTYNQTYNIESSTDDNRTVNITNLNLVSNEDYNKNGYSSTYNLNFDLNTTDNLPEDYYILISYNTYGNSYYSGNFISETIKGATSISLLLNAGELLIKNYYDLEIKVFSSSNVLLKTYTKMDFSSLGLVKFEKISQDI